jgi:hypothetical protein
MLTKYKATITVINHNLDRLDDILDRLAALAPSQSDFKSSVPDSNMYIMATWSGWSDVDPEGVDMNQVFDEVTRAVLWGNGADCLVQGHFKFDSPEKYLVSTADDWERVSKDAWPCHECGSLTKELPGDDDCPRCLACVSEQVDRSLQAWQAIDNND